MPTDRRSFLKQSAMLAGAAAMPRIARGAAVGANDRLRIGLIGSGGRGRSLLIEVAGLVKEKLVNAEVTAVSDPWRDAREAGADDVAKLMGGKPELYARHEDLLDKARVDAVIIATPDFWHVPVLLDAIRAGKDVYVEKPLAWSLDEAKAARDAVRKSRKWSGSSSRRSRTRA
jgi:predicted dehydrogenase